jgi:precorrin-6A/cobalt-precorrin-6A reductase
VPVRTGGFGGAAGLAAYLAENRIELLIDATHPFARRISANAERAAKETGTPLIRLDRIFLAIGRQEAYHFDSAPQHHYLVRSVDPVEPPLTVPSVEYLLARGPFAVEDEIALLRDRRIDVVVSKNSGGEGTYGKIAAARALGLPVVMVDRGGSGRAITVESVEAALRLIDHVASGERKRGV